MALCKWHDARLQSPREDDRQRAFRELQRHIRLECLGRQWFLDLDDACEKVKECRTEYNEVRPHSAIGDRTPLSLVQQPRQHAEASNRPEVLSRTGLIFGMRPRHWKKPARAVQGWEQLKTRKFSRESV